MMVKIEGRKLNFAPFADKKHGLVTKYKRRYVNECRFRLVNGKLKLSKKERRYHMKTLWMGKAGCVCACQPVAGTSVSIALSMGISLSNKKAGCEWSTSDEKGVNEFWAEDESQRWQKIRVEDRKSGKVMQEGGVVVPRLGVISNTDPRHLFPWRVIPVQWLYDVGYWTTLFKQIKKRRD